MIRLLQPGRKHRLSQQRKPASTWRGPKQWNQPSSKMALSSPCNTDRRKETTVDSATWRRCDQSACSSGCHSIGLTGLTSSFLIGTAALTLTGLPLYLWFFGLDWFQVVLFFVMLSAIGFSVTLGYL